MRYILLILLFISCGEKFEFDYKVLGPSTKVEKLEFSSNKIEQEGKNTLLESKFRGKNIYTSLYIFSVAGEGTSRTILPVVKFSQDNAYISIKFKTINDNYNDLANLLQLNFIIKKEGIKYLVFNPMSL